jgi:hypothetical protein
MLIFDKISCVEVKLTDQFRISIQFKLYFLDTCINEAFNKNLLLFLNIEQVIRIIMKTLKQDNI